MAAATAWQPQQAGLIQLCNLFATAQKGENQTEIVQQLDQYKQYPDFNNYLAYIFATAEQVPVEVRQSAGLCLKNSLPHTYKHQSAALQDYVKNALVPMLAHVERPLRHTAGSSIAAIVVSTGIDQWPQLVGLLLQCLQSGNTAALDGGLDTLFKVVEESPRQMEVSVPVPAGAGAAGVPQAVSTLLVPPLLKLLQGPPGDAKRQALATLNLMTRDMPIGIANNLDAYVTALFALAHDPQLPVRREVVRGLVQLLTLQPDKLEPHLYQVIEYMLRCNEASEEDIALESAEFWLAFCESRLDEKLLAPFLHRLIPLLMKNMVFEEYDEEVQEAQEAEVAGGRVERDSELRPVHHKSAHKHGFEEDGDDDDDEVMSHWTLRKCSAAGLDRLAVLYGDDLLPQLLPIVSQRLQEADWRARESAILALGAVSEGCHTGLLPHLTNMVEMLLPKLADPQPMVRIITCWTLGRYAYWLLADAQEGASPPAPGGASPVAGGAALPAVDGAATPSLAALAQVLRGLLTCVADKNKFVQDSACSAVATLFQTVGVEECGDVLAPHLNDIVPVLTAALTSYGKRNLHLACDALCMLGEAVGPALGQPQLVATYMPALWARVASLGPNDRELIPLLEVAIMAVGVLGPALAQWAPNMYGTAMSIITAQSAVQAQGNGRSGGRSRGARGAGRAGTPGGAGTTGDPVIEYDSELHAIALDVVSALAERLGPNLEALIAGTPLVPAILAACQDSNADVRQSGFALAGDLSRGCVHQLAPVAPQLVAAALAALAPNVVHENTMRSCNNACWSLGELAIRLPAADVSAWAGGVAERAASLLAAGPSRLPQSLLENAAITLGRVACQAPDMLAPHLAHFCVPWCQALRNVRDDVEKQQAFRGLLLLIARHPEPFVHPGQAFGSLAGALVSWRTVGDKQLLAEMVQVLRTLQARMQATGAWQPAVGALDRPMAEKLAALAAGALT